MVVKKLHSINTFHINQGEVLHIVLIAEGGNKMKSRSTTTRRHHLRQTRKGKITPVRQHLMHFWSGLSPSTKKAVGRVNKGNVQKVMNNLLFNPRRGAGSPETLTLIVPKPNDKKYKFLKASTEFDVKGRWLDIVEDNTAIQIQFKDTKDERVGKDLINLVKIYNAEYVGEQVPMAYTEPIEETTLTQDLDGNGVPDEYEGLNVLKIQGVAK